MAYPYDAIVVLANLMDEKALLNEESRRRADLAISKFQSDLAPVLVMCGWNYRPDCPTPIALALRDYAIKQGVPKDAIALEVRSRDTVGDAVFCRERGHGSILVVTSSYHVQRARTIFSFVYGTEIEVIGAPVEALMGVDESELRSLDAFRATFSGVTPGDGVAIMRRLRQSHPYYNGEVYLRLVDGQD